MRAFGKLVLRQLLVRGNIYSPLPRPLSHRLSSANASASDASLSTDEWLTTNQVTLSGSNIPRPVYDFNESNFPREIETLLCRNYNKPTIIQSISWPVAMSGRDQISIARTGSGKTLGFILPGILHTLKQGRRPPGGGPSVLVMLPTRELAQQVLAVTRDYCGATGLQYTCLYGGASRLPQANDLRRGVDICIATPGRLLDFLQEGELNLDRCTYLVLDEADRMLDMGFEPQIRKVVARIRSDRQTLMFSATWPKSIRDLASDFQHDPVFLNVGSMEISANPNIQQIVEIVDSLSKRDRLYEVLETTLEEPQAKVLVFVATKRQADNLTRELRRKGWAALCIHGDKSQRERDWALSANERVAFSIGIFKARVLSDVDDIKMVINYDYPIDSEDYVHRIGRTGRRDKKGIAHSFFTPEDAPKAADLIKVLEQAQQPVPPELASLVNSSAARAGGGGRGRGRGAPRTRYGGGNRRSDDFDWSGGNRRSDDFGWSGKRSSGEYGWASKRSGDYGSGSHRAPYKRDYRGGGGRDGGGRHGYHDEDDGW